MAFYSASRVGISLDGKSLFASDLQINSSPSVESHFREDERTSSNKYLPTAGLRGEVSFNYFLTGRDFLRDYFIKDAPISGNVGGLYFGSGYLSHYSFSFSQFKPIEISATIQYYGPLEGDFAPTPDQTSLTGVLDFSNALINTTGIDSTNKVISANYEFSAETIASYQDGSVLPSNIIYGQKSRKVSLESYSITGKTVVEANDASLEILFRDNELQVTDSFAVSGKVINLETSLTAGQQVYSSFTLSQDGAGPKPLITSFSPTSSNVNTSVTINGSNFNGVKDIFFFDTRVESFEVNDAGTQITTLVPREAISGPIKVIAIGGVAISSSNFTVTNSIGVG